MTDIRIERARLDPGTPLVYRDDGRVVRVAFDPGQITEEATLALLCLRLPRLVGDVRVIRHMLHRRVAGSCTAETIR
ncbi:hypothetical protein [Streptomyces sediminimaris]|uniref:hypothetical protein n=1 Tax=Streptomyces sediminimaris TaxID=3383721 RepID=UPI00399ACA24